MDERVLACRMTERADATGVFFGKVTMRTSTPAADRDNFSTSFRRKFAEGHRMKQI
jgi:hypothetical protein